MEESGPPGEEIELRTFGNGQYYGRFMMTLANSPVLGYYVRIKCWLRGGMRVAGLTVCGPRLRHGANGAGR